MAVVFNPNEDLPKALGQITDAVVGFIQPYKDQELALRALISKDPDLAQKLSDLAFTSPGSIAGFAGPNAENYFKNLSPTAKAKTDVAIRPALDILNQDPQFMRYAAAMRAAPDAGGTPGAAAKSELDETISNLTTDMLQNDPRLRTATGYRVAGKTDPGKAEYSAQRATWFTAYPHVQQLMAEGRLQTEFQKFMSGQPSELTANDIQAAFNTEIGQTLKLPYVEGQKMARVKEIADTRWQLQFNNYRKTMNALILKEVLDLKSTTRTIAWTGDFVRALGGDQDMIDEFGGSTEEGYQAALKDIDSRSPALIQSRIAAKEVAAAITRIKQMPKNQREGWLTTLNTLAGQMIPPVQFMLNERGYPVTIEGTEWHEGLLAPIFGPTRIPSDRTPTQQTPTRNEGNTPGPQPVQRIGDGVSSVGGGTSQSQSQTNPPSQAPVQAAPVVEDEGPPATEPMPAEEPDTTDGYTPPPDTTAAGNAYAKPPEIKRKPTSAGKGLPAIRAAVREQLRETELPRRQSVSDVGMVGPYGPDIQKVYMAAKQFTVDHLERVLATKKITKAERDYILSNAKDAKKAKK